MECTEGTVYHQLCNILIKHEIISKGEIYFTFQSSDPQMCIYSRSPEVHVANSQEQFCACTLEIPGTGILQRTGGVAEPVRI